MTCKMKGKKQKVAVIGAGSWGTAIALLLAGKGVDVSLWVYEEDKIPDLERHRENSFLPGHILPPNISFTNDYKEAVRGTRDICMVVPSHGFRKVFEGLVHHIPADAHIISAVKGIEQDSLQTMTQVVEEIRMLRHPQKKQSVAVLSGPSFAKEVASGLPTAVTVCCRDINKAKYLQNLFSTEKFRVYAGRDVIGLEICAALKNIIAIAAGVSDGLGYGLNTRAALISRGLAEMTRLGIRMGAEPQTFSGLGGLGDLVHTCTGDLSRNRTVGLKLGQGKRIDDILGEMKMVAEGGQNNPVVLQSCEEVCR